MYVVSSLSLERGQGLPTKHTRSGPKSWFHYTTTTHQLQSKLAGPHTLSMKTPHWCVYSCLAIMEAIQHGWFHAQHILSTKVHQCHTLFQAQKHQCGCFVLDPLSHTPSTKHIHVGCVLSSGPF